MQTAALWVRRPRPCLPLPRRHGVLLVGGQHTPARLPHALHPCRLGGPGTLGTQLSFHLVAGSGSLDLVTPPWLPDYTNWLHCQRDPRMFTHTLPRGVPMHTPGPTHRPRFDGGFVFHTMMTSSARRTVCVRGRAQNKSSMRSLMETSA